MNKGVLFILKIHPSSPPWEEGVSLCMCVCIYFTNVPSILKGILVGTLTKLILPQSIWYRRNRNFFKTDIGLY